MIAAVGKAPAAPPVAAKVARQFEALFVQQLLKAAHAAALADDPLSGAGGETFRDMQDQVRAEALAAAAPLGVARLLAAKVAPPSVNKSAAGGVAGMEIRR